MSQLGSGGWRPSSDAREGTAQGRVSARRLARERHPHPPNEESRTPAGARSSCRGHGATILKVGLMLDPQLFQDGETDRRRPFLPDPVPGLRVDRQRFNGGWPVIKSVAKVRALSLEAGLRVGLRVEIVGNWWGRAEGSDFPAKQKSH